MLKILDLSRQTHCRCEPNELAGSLFGVLPDSCLCMEHDDGRFAEIWDNAVEWAGMRMGERDSFPLSPKRHIWPMAQRLQIYRLLKHGTVRRAMGFVCSSLRRAEWELPRWIGNREALAEAAVVLKTGPVPGWADWIVRNRPETKMVHVVRHPAGFLHAYHIRWLTGRDVGTVCELNRARLKKISQVDIGWAERFGDIERMSVCEAELWYWVYVCEVTHCAGDGRDNYVLIRDEDVVGDPVGAGKRLYEACGLEWNDYAQAWLEGMADHWREHAEPWRELVSDEDAELIERILGGSMMRDWWSLDEVVSRCDYVAYW